MHLFFRHLVEHLGRGRKLRAQAFGKAAIDAAVLFLIGDGERQHFLFGQVGKSLHGGLGRWAGRPCILELFHTAKSPL